MITEQLDAIEENSKKELVQYQLQTAKDLEGLLQKIDANEKLMNEYLDGFT